MLQNINMDKSQSEGEEEDMKFYLCQMATKDVQTRAGKAAKKRLGFYKS